MIQSIYPVVVTTYDIFQYGEGESAGSQDYLSVANKVYCESGGGEGGWSGGQPGTIVTEQSFQYGWGKCSGYWRRIGEIF